MVLKPFHTEALNGLCSKDQLDLLDSIDCLRSQGISHYVSLPQIIVCGDQSSGKSSVLEAISGVPFPTKSNLCTRFPIELVLRKTSHIGVSVSIVPHESRSESGQLSLGGFHEKLDGFDGLPTLIENAKAALAISTHGRAFSKDLLRVEVSGPDRPHLTIVDLPGLIHSETKQQSASDVELVQDVVQAYMKEPRSIILAVVSAKNDYANQIVLKLARAADKKGNRTLGVITKPDTLIASSESEAMYVSLARNQDVEFRLGWHVLKNMDSETGEWSLADRDVKEEEFFSQGIWEDLPRSLLGVDKLRNRLSKSLIKASVDGTYNDPFFEDAQSEPGYQKRIRAVVQNLNLDFAERIARRGHYREIIDSPRKTAVPRGVTATTREDFMDHIQHLVRRTKGRELPGTFNPMIVADLFLEQSSPWEALTRGHIEKVWQAAKKFLTLTTTYVADTATSKTLFQKIFEPALKELLGTLNAKSTELLTPHQKSHPITYNHYFTEALQKARNERSRDEYTRIIKDFFGTSSIESVALKRFVDDIAIEVIEAKLISPLHNIFSPITVTSMSADLVTCIAGESEENRAQRAQLNKQLEVLMKGIETCRRFVGVRILGGVDDSTVQSENTSNSTDYVPSGSDEAFDDSASDDGRSLSDSFHRGASEPIQYPAPVPLGEREVVEELNDEPKEEIYISSKSKKDKKKSKVAAKWFSEYD
ncbi:uncharacterized protein K444DRAFT_659015 [Hyaloscypha bicolor E]|uniref:Dynamin family protein n=1 Tax=Hyaloscypha bicolor E TaxID=1095630 RepID=A0A2J6TUS0_9HELO|nr:uncharacterized protein K444DRAFT_659015 [Hyaloscypha bicolor E]PMD66783.1 hypothetical protein K444DRAFT_659015 [Hyaloscypha bicolor E]